MRAALVVFVASATASCLPHADNTDTAARARVTSARTTVATPLREPDPLPLWVDGPAKRATLEAVDARAREGGTIDEATPIPRVALFESVTLEGGHDGGVQRPMMELLRHLERRGFVTYVFTENDLDATKVRAADAYGVSTARVLEAASGVAAADELERRLGTRPMLVIVRGRGADEIAVTRGTKGNAAASSADEPPPALAVISASKDFFAPVEIRSF